MRSCVFGIKRKRGCHTVPQWVFQRGFYTAESCYNLIQATIIAYVKDLPIDLGCYYHKIREFYCPFSLNFFYRTATFDADKELKRNNT